MLEKAKKTLNKDEESSPSWRLRQRIRMKSLDPLRARKIFIRKKEDGPDCTVSDNEPSSVTLYTLK